MKKESSIGNGSLWASAFFVVSMILFSADKHSRIASADAVNTGNGFTVLTTPNGQGSDSLFLIDDENAMLMVYDIPSPQNKQFIQPVASWSLPAMFSQARN